MSESPDQNFVTAHNYNESVARLAVFLYEIFALYKCLLLLLVLLVLLLLLLLLNDFVCVTQPCCITDCDVQGFTFYITHKQFVTLPWRAS